MYVKTDLEILAKSTPLVADDANFCFMHALQSIHAKRAIEWMCMHWVHVVMCLGNLIIVCQARYWRRWNRALTNHIYFDFIARLLFAAVSVVEIINRTTLHRVTINCIVAIAGSLYIYAKQIKNPMVKLGWVVTFCGLLFAEFTTWLQQGSLNRSFRLCDLLCVYVFRVCQCILIIFRLQWFNLFITVLRCMCVVCI